MKKLAPGEQAPQFVLFSFDGGGWHERWRSFMEEAEPHDARFTGFLTGIYLLSDGAKGNYTGPGHSPGRASVGFGGTPDEVQTLVDDLNNAWLAGHEVGTHYNGHFCDGNDPSANDWSSAEWDAEIAQFNTFWQNWPALNGIASPRPLRVPLDDVKGGRTPCLEGRWDQLAIAWANAGYRYDTSQVSNGMVWPRVENNVWDFRMPTVEAPTMGRVIAMDYNFWVKMNGGANEPARLDLSSASGCSTRTATCTTRPTTATRAAGHRQPLQRVERQCLQPGRRRLHGRGVRQARHLLRHLLRRDRLDGAAGPGHPRRPPGPPRRLLSRLPNPYGTGTARHRTGPIPPAGA